MNILRFIRDTCKTKPHLLSSVLNSSDPDLSTIIVELCVNATFNPNLKIGLAQKKTLRNHAKIIEAFARCSELKVGKLEKAVSLLKKHRKKIPLLLLISICASQLGLNS